MSNVQHLLLSNTIFCDFQMHTDTSLTFIYGVQGGEVPAANYFFTLMGV